MSSKTQRWQRFATIAVAASVVIGLIVYVIANKPAATLRRLEQRITTVILPPPPPPPPEEKPPEPEEKKLEEPTPNVPQPQQEEPQAEPEALQAREGPGANDFGLSAGSGNGFTLGGGDKPSGGFGAYGRIVQQAIRECLLRDKRTRKASFVMTIHLWLSTSGAVERAEIVASDSDQGLQQAVVSALDGLIVNEAPPAQMPQPMKLRIGARDM